tara:strand:- start:13032 stop:13217 length:186 start_codon:yes stop_codon:yes gene_type:complete
MVIRKAINGSSFFCGDKPVDGSEVNVQQAMNTLSTAVNRCGLGGITENETDHKSALSAVPG